MKSHDPLSIPIPLTYLHWAQRTWSFIVVYFNIVQLLFEICWMVEIGVITHVFICACACTYTCACACACVGGEEVQTCVSSGLRDDLGRVSNFTVDTHCFWLWFIDWDVQKCAIHSIQLIASVCSVDIVLYVVFSQFICSLCIFKLYHPFGICGAQCTTVDLMTWWHVWCSFKCRLFLCIYRSFFCLYWISPFKKYGSLG